MKRKAVAGMLAAMMVMSAALPVFAEGTTYTAINGGTATMDKYLVIEKEATIPGTVFNFTIAPGTAQNATATTSAVKPGPSGAVIGESGAGTVTFTANQTTFATAQAQTNNVRGTISGSTDVVPGLDENHVYAKSPVTIDLTDASFNEPGVYRYVITEAASAENASHGIVNDATATRYLDVYVADSGSGLEVTGYVLHNSDDTVNADGSSLTAANKDGGYTNSLETFDLDLGKTVTGNQGSRDEYFEFTVSLGNLGAGQVVKLAGSYDGTTKVTGANATANTNPTTPLTAGNDGTISTTVWLQNGQDIQFLGLPKNATYSINETKATLDAEGYSTVIAATGDTTGVTQSVATAVAPTTGTAATKIEDTALTADTDIMFTNDRHGTVPTGIILSIIPYLGIGALAGGSFIAVSKSKKKKEEDEAEA